MGPEWITAVVGALLGVGGLSGIIAAVLTHRRETASAERDGLEKLVTALSARLAQVEADLDEHRAWRREQETRYSTLWAYCRQLIDYAYRHRRDDAPPLPDMPNGLA